MQLHAKNVLINTLATSQPSAEISLISELPINTKLSSDTFHHNSTHHTICSDEIPPGLQNKTLKIHGIDGLFDK